MSASKTVLLAVLISCCCFADTLAQATVDKSPPNCKHEELRDFTGLVCRNGYWPGPSAAPLELPANTTGIYTSGRLVTAPDAALPALPLLTALHLNEIRVDDPAAGRWPAFPLQSFTRLLDRSKIKSLTLGDLSISAVTRALFAGFSNLEELTIESAVFGKFDLDSFGAFEGGHFRSLVLNDVFDSRGPLTTFHWDVLAPVAQSLQSVHLSRNPGLLSIDFSPNWTAAGDRPLPRLTSIEIFSNRRLANLSGRVVHTFPTQQTGDQQVRVRFIRNGNECAECQIVRPLIEWARSPSSGPVALELDCKKQKEESEWVQLWNATRKSWEPYTEPVNCRVQAV